jgi:RNase P/RNase MRP subunit p29
VSRRDGSEPEASPEALASEFLGAAVRIDRHPGLGRLPVSGTIVDETLGTFLVRTTPTGAVRRIPKSGAVGTVLLGERELPLRGDALRVRPEDRPKRLLGRGRRSFR